MPDTVRIDFAYPARDRAYVSGYSLLVLQGAMQTAGVTRILITSTYRSPADQARVMYDNLTPGRTMYKGYGQQVEAVGKRYQKQAADGIIAGIDQGNPIPVRERAIHDMEAKIMRLEHIYGVGCVSNHHFDPKTLNVLDISEHNLRPKSALTAFIAALDAASEVSRIGVPKGTAAHGKKQFKETQHCIHVEISQIAGKRTDAPNILAASRMA